MADSIFNFNSRHETFSKNGQTKSSISPWLKQNQILAAPAPAPAPAEYHYLGAGGSPNVKQGKGKARSMEKGKKVLIGNWKINLQLLQSH